MSLLTEYMEECQFMNRAKVSDGYGGTVTTWTAGAKFNAAITLDTSIEARVAQAQGVKNLYTVTVSKATSLDYGDVIQRLSDKKYFRITSDGTDKKTPASAGLDMRQASAEELTALPT